MAKQAARKRWLMPIVVLAVASLLVFLGFYLLDWLISDPGKDPASLYYGFQPSTISDATGGMAGMMAAVLGIVITVVSIIVQLTAERYTGVAQMFMRDRINISVMAYFVVACVCGVWLSMALREQFVPRVTILMMMAATTFGLVLMLPYFAYVFWFLEPGNIIARIRRDAVVTVTRAARNGGSVADLQISVIAAMDELTDITSNSISGKDKIVASRAVDAFKDFILEYLAVKKQATKAWFLLGDQLRDNPDFVAMDPESLVDLEQRKTWVEWKALRHYLGLYREAKESMPDINYLIAIDTRYIAEAAAEHADAELVELCYHFFNSYMRATLNAGDVRTAYNVLNQYRLLVESLLALGRGDDALSGVKYIKYYGQVSFNMNLPFVTETAAYDISALCQRAHETRAATQDQMLSHFLELDQPLRAKRQESGLLGVRKAQVKLAAYYLAAGEQAKAKLIADDMKEEPPDRLRAIRDQLAKVESKDFWEIIDRGRNFEFMPPGQRAQMETFFSWLKTEDSPIAQPVG
ncbi:MAG TPA: DUF2254 family protein [Kofleriaceae bacterium]|nr:DUF2254 family protein [Kofleriaceae bacterium]